MSKAKNSKLNMKSKYDIVKEKYYPPPEQRVKRVEKKLFNLDRNDPEFRKPARRGPTPRRMLVSPDALTEICARFLDNKRKPYPYKWTNIDVIRWIDQLGFPQYRNIFYRNYVTGRKLVLLDASTLVTMNISNLDHIKIITRDIQRLYGFKEHPGYSYKYYPNKVENDFKFYISRTGPKYENARFSDALRKLGLLQSTPKCLTHWQKLEKRLEHIPLDVVLQKPFKPKEKTFRSYKPPPKAKLLCDCVPPCECNWPERYYRLPWTFKLLVERNGAKQRTEFESLEQIADAIYNVQTTEKFDDPLVFKPSQPVLNLLKKVKPNRYNVEVTEMKF